MYVYVISAGRDRHKIGKARDPDERRCLLQTGCPDQLVLVYSRAVTNSRGVEAKAHAALSAHRIRGEWFSVPEAHAIEIVDQAVAALGASDPNPIERVGRNAHRKSWKALRYRRRLAGGRQSTFWVPPELAEKFDQMSMVSGSRSEAINAAIMALGEEGGADGPGNGIAK